MAISSTFAVETVDEAARIFAQRAFHATGNEKGIIYFIPADSGRRATVSQLAKMAVGMASRGQPLVIGGADARMAAGIITAAFKRCRPGSLNNLQVVCAIRAEDELAAKSAIASTGATFFRISPD